MRSPALLALLLALPACKVGRETTVAGHESRWAQLDRAQKMAYMVDVVEPKMKAAFIAYDSKRFADFDCGTCHGSGADDGSFAMPNPELPHLREAGIYAEHRKADPEIVKFMWKQVDQGMGELLGMSVGHGGEFDCRSCHVIDDAH